MSFLSRLLERHRARSLAREQEWFIAKVKARLEQAAARGNSYSRDDVRRTMAWIDAHRAEVLSRTLCHETIFDALEMSVLKALMSVVHKADDGRGPRRVTVDGREIQRVVYADTEQGFVRVVPQPARVDPITDEVVTETIYGLVEVVPLDAPRAQERG